MEVRKCKRSLWRMFGRYHYLSDSLNPTAQCVAVMWHAQPIAFCATIHFPHPKISNFKKCTRLVVLPDYQGAGIGRELLSIEAKRWSDKGNRYIITTSQKGMMHSLKKSAKWVCTQHSIIEPAGEKNTRPKLKEQMSTRRRTASFEYSSTQPLQSFGAK